MQPHVALLLYAMTFVPPTVHPVFWQPLSLLQHSKADVDPPILVDFPKFVVDLPICYFHPASDFLVFLFFVEQGVKELLELDSLMEHPIQQAI